MDGSSLPIRTFEVFRRIAGPATVVTGALFYFGWVRSRAVAAYFGIDVELLNYSTTDLVLRSVSTIFPVLVLTAILSLIGLKSFDWYVERASRTPEGFRSVAKVNSAGQRIRRVAWQLIVPGIVCLSLFEQLLNVNRVLPLLGAVSTIAGLALLAGSRRMQTATGVSADGLEGHTPISARLSVPLGIAGLAAVFVTVFIVADWRGTQTAINREKNIAESFPEVVLTSQHELHLFGSPPGIVLTDQGGLSTPWTRRYDGLRLWIEANDRWFLIPDNWPENKVVHVVNIDETVRLDVQR